MKTINTIEVHLWDGGDRHNYGYTFFTDTVSEPELKQRFKHCVLIERNIVIFDNLQDFDENQKQLKVLKVLEKLTKEERELLGF